jgi:hypothetical protein
VRLWLNSSPRAAFRGIRVAVRFVLTAAAPSFKSAPKQSLSSKTSHPEAVSSLRVGSITICRSARVDATALPWLRPPSWAVSDHAQAPVAFKCGKLHFTEFKHFLFAEL